MNSNEHPMNERQAFEELLGDGHFDDSVSDQHQSDLRSRVLQAFDQTSCEMAVVELCTPSAGQRQCASWNRSFGYAVILAVGLIGLVAVWFYRGDRSAELPMVQQPTAADVTEDSQLLASLAKVNAFRDEVSREAMFDAIAMCELDHEGRMLFDAPNSR